MSTNNRSQGLDLVRASAVLAVCASHYLGQFHPTTATGLAAFLGGGGVQAFFALSGYLIGGILLEVAEAPSIGAWWRFMVRRWGRTLPVYYAVGAALLLLAPPAHDVAGTILSYSSMTQNLLVGLPAGSWYASTWSLTIEEIFYFGFAASLLASRRYLGKWTTWPCILAFLLFPLVVRTVLYYRGMAVDPHAALPHLDGIAAGVAVAALFRSHGEELARMSRLAGCCGLILVLSAWASYLLPGATPAWLAWTPWMGCCGFALLLVPASRLTSLGAAWRPVRAIAAYSYPIYLVHGEVLLMLRSMFALPDTIMQDVLLLLVWATLTGVAVYHLHKYVEVPFMRLRPPQEPSRPVPAVALAA